MNRISFGIALVVVGISSSRAFPQEVAGYIVLPRSTPMKVGDKFLQSILPEHIAFVQDANEGPWLSPKLTGQIARKNLALEARAIEYFSDQIRRNPRDPMGYWGRGEAKIACGRFEEAEKDFDAALRLDPGAANALTGRERVPLQLAGDRRTRRR
jgi:tetratricopeptide (TPR) repeat protein